MKTWNSILLGLGIALLSVPDLQAQYSLQKSAVAGGGAVTGSAGRYSLNGTVGQKEASGVSSGGSYVLVGGFWAMPTAIQAPGAPRLGVEWAGNGKVKVFWPLPATGFVLDQGPFLVNEPALPPWTQVALPYSTNASQVFIEVPPSQSRFYRLRKLP